jgi:hypothetical protein
MKAQKYQSIYLFVVIILVFGTAFVPVTIGVFSDFKYLLSDISFDDASLVAINKLSLIDKDVIIIDHDILSDDEGKLLCYVFDLYPSGYIVVSGYGVLPPVIAYSTTGSFDSDGSILKDIIRADLTSRLDFFSMISEETIYQNQYRWTTLLKEDDGEKSPQVVQQWPSIGTTRSGGWLDTKWHQNAPFNNMVPIDQSTGGRSVAGCPSITMAQICNYHQTINGIIFNDTDDYYHTYNGNNFWIDNDHILYDFPSFPELNTYLDDLILHYQQGIDLTDDDKASLSFACGIAAKQVYHPSGSGTFGVIQAYDAYQRFNFEDVDLLDENDPDVYERIQENIKDGLPVHLAVVNEAWNKGHNLVIDGYNSEGYYHLNFGWGGSYDGWYKIPEELPFELTVLEGVVVDITDDNAISNLHSNGNLYWPDIKPGSTVSGSFEIENIGEPGSSIDWEIASWPEWGTWTFTPTSGTGLTPETGAITIDVSVAVPDDKNTDFKGTIRINNIDNTSDYCQIHVMLSTPQTYSLHAMFSTFLQNLSYNFPLIQRMLRINV